MARSTPRSTQRRTAEHGLHIPDQALAQMREELPSVAEHVVAAIIEEVPSYTDAFSGPMGETIRNAVQLALGGFLSLASGRRGADLRTPAAPAVEGAYQLGRGEARSGRSTDALLAAYRIGARVSWRELSLTAVRSGIDGEVLVDFAGLVFAYIDELSAASVAGHTDETETTGRVRQRLLARVAQLLLAGAPDDEVLEAVEQAGWPAPATLTAVLVPESQVRPVLGRGRAGDARGRGPSRPQGCRVDARRLGPAPGAGRAPAAPRHAAAARWANAARWPAPPCRGSRCGRRTSARSGPTPSASRWTPRLSSPGSSCTPTRPPSPTCAPASWHRCRTCGPPRRRSWRTPCGPGCSCQGRRDDVAAALFVHPQTVRYRMGQIRDLYGDRLDDPDVVLELLIALA